MDEKKRSRRPRVLRANRRDNRTPPPLPGERRERKRERERDARMREDSRKQDETRFHPRRRKTTTPPCGSCPHYICVVESRLPYAVRRQYNVDKIYVDLLPKCWICGRHGRERVTICRLAVRKWHHFYLRLFIKFELYIWLHPRGPRPLQHTHTRTQQQQQPNAKATQGEAEQNQKYFCELRGSASSTCMRETKAHATFLTRR